MKKTLVILLILLVMAACAPAASTPVEDSLMVTEGTEIEVLIQEFALDPPELAIRAGATVTWVNLDAARHTVSAEKGGFNSPVLMYGDRFSFTFETPGEYRYSNKYHPDMRGRIIVVP